MPTLSINGNIRTNTTAGWTADATVYSAKTILVTTDALYTGTDQRKWKLADGVQTWSNLDYMPIGTQTFAQVLANGNIVPDGQAITGSGGQIYIDFGNDLYFAVTTDANNYLTPYFYVINDPGGQGVYGVLSNGEYHIGSGDDTFVGKKIWIDSNSAQIVHDVLAKLDAPNINIPNETASRYLYLDASKNIDTKTTAQVLSDIGAQPLDDQLTEIAALSPSNDDFIQEKAGVFTNRTPAQVSADLTANLMNGYQGMELIVTGAGVNPADSTVYYIGSPFNIAPTTTADNRRVYVRKACTIKAADIGIVVAGVLGSAENATIAIRVNNTTDTAISAAVTHTAVYQQFSNIGLSIALNAGDYFEIKITHPAYATNPTNVQTTVMIYAE